MHLLTLDSPPANWLLIRPAWRQHARIATAVAEADTSFRSVTYKSDILVVDDGSSDGAVKLVERAVKLCRLGPATIHPLDLLRWPQTIPQVSQAGEVLEAKERKQADVC